MDSNDQQKAFSTELEALVIRFRREYDMSLAIYVGCLEIQKQALILEVFNEDKE